MPDYRLVIYPTGGLWLNHDRDYWPVFVNAGGRARLPRVWVGLVNETHAEIRGGLAPDDEVILFPSETVADGVRLVRRVG